MPNYKRKYPTEDFIINDVKILWSKGIKYIRKSQLSIAHIEVQCKCGDIRYIKCNHILDKNNIYLNNFIGLCRKCHYKRMRNLIDKRKYPTEDFIINDNIIKWSDGIKSIKKGILTISNIKVICKCGNIRYVQCQHILDKNNIYRKSFTGLCRKCSENIAEKYLKDIYRPDNLGSSYINNSGYIIIRRKDHPITTKKGEMLEHKYVAYNSLWSYLQLFNMDLEWDKNWVVHHINENKLDNNIENLYIFRSNSEHSKFHRSFYNNPSVSKK